MRCWPAFNYHFKSFPPCYAWPAYKHFTPNLSRLSNSISLHSHNSRIFAQRGQDNRVVTLLQNKLWHFWRRTIQLEHGITCSHMIWLATVPKFWKRNWLSWARRVSIKHTRMAYLQLRNGSRRKGLHPSPMHYSTPAPRESLHLYSAGAAGVAEAQELPCTCARNCSEGPVSAEGFDVTHRDPALAQGTSARESLPGNPTKKTSTSQI